MTQDTRTPTFGGYSLTEAIDGLHAGLDTPGSGIRDENLRIQVRDYLNGLPDDEARVVISLVVRRLCLSDKALDQGYGWEDARSLIEYLENGLFW